MPSNMNLSGEDSRGFRKAPMHRATVVARNNQVWVYAGVGLVALLSLIFYFRVVFTGGSSGGMYTGSGLHRFDEKRVGAAPPMPGLVASKPSLVAQPPMQPQKEAPAPPPPAAAPAAVAAAPARVADPRKRLVVLHTADGRINTGVWPSWGGDPPTTATLNWGTAGVVVDKACPVQCTFSHDNSAIGDADAVVTEVLNWPKFGLSGDFPVPARTRPNPAAGAPSALLGGPAPPRLPLVGLFGYEPKDYFPQYSLANPTLASQFDFSLTYEASTTLPISLVCPWGRPVSSFLAPPPAKLPGRTLAYFSEHGAPPSARVFLNQLFEAAGATGIHAYVHMKNAELPPEAVGEPYALANRMAFVATYRFLLITEQVEEPDFLSPEWSQALSVGTVPVYMGIPNIASYAPPAGWVDARAFATGGDLWEYLSGFAEQQGGGGGEGDGAAGAAGEGYARFFDWKVAAREAENVDGSGVPGTGDGVVPGACGAEGVEAVAAWPRPTATGPGALPLSPSQHQALSPVAAGAWRCFRKHLDMCVHYSECRVCRLVHEAT